MKKTTGNNPLSCFYLGKETSRYNIIFCEIVKPDPETYRTFTQILATGALALIFVGAGASMKKK